MAQAKEAETPLDLEAALVALLQKAGAKAQAETAQERQEAQHMMQSEHDRQRKETHYWITFNRMGDQDNVDVVDIGAAGVMYHIRKGQRVPLPHSAIQALRLAVRDGFDHGRPVEINGKRYLRRIRESEYSYQLEGECTPEEAQAWRQEQARNDRSTAELLPLDGGNEDLVEAGSY